MTGHLLVFRFMPIIWIWCLTVSRSYPCPYLDLMVPTDDQPPIWSISSNGHPEALRRSLNVCRKLWVVSTKSFFNHLPNAFEARVARSQQIGTRLEAAGERVTASPLGLEYSHSIRGHRYQSCTIGGQ